MPFPSPDTRQPVRLPDGTQFSGTVFLKAVLEHPNLSIGAYTYYSDDEMPEPDLLRRRLFPYLYGDQRVEIGKFCSLAMGVSFVTASANHRYDGISTFPFAIFDGMSPERPSMPEEPPSPMVVGHDCWLGRNAMLTPRARLGDGVIVGAGSVVTGPVPDYAVVAGNPARVVRMRFAPGDIARIKAVAWWNWPTDAILAAEAEICGGDIDALERVASRY